MFPNKPKHVPVVSHLQLVLSHSVHSLSEELDLGLILMIHLLEERNRMEDRQEEESELKKENIRIM